MSKVKVWKRLTHTVHVESSPESYELHRRGEFVTLKRIVTDREGIQATTIMDFPIEAWEAMIKLDLDK
jgi:hypothetical protein